MNFRNLIIKSLYLLIIILNRLVYFNIGQMYSAQIPSMVKPTHFPLCLHMK